MSEMLQGCISNAVAQFVYNIPQIGCHVLYLNYLRDLS